MDCQSTVRQQWPRQTNDATKAGAAGSEGAHGVRGQPQRDHREQLGGQIEQVRHASDDALFRFDVRPGTLSPRRHQDQSDRWALQRSIAVCRGNRDKIFTQSGMEKSLIEASLDS
eukprot:TRINITY_DN1874_c0_g1_i5.p2 TRINITY_DN1874_c0_g1~~TRINITY_DN1874_c0_g1_i5.p2  ORF type:complete len:115 (-),score=2.82 TRINITY_DN1874_c0_g1_i5:90-434(-)